MLPSHNRTDKDQEIYDVIIIGAGPCGLAVAARLREQHPSALFTDEEHARFSWISSRASMKNRRNGRVKSGGQTHARPAGPSILVLDESGDQWMTKWKTLFRKLNISHLRSPMFFHPDPSDRDALLAFCHETGRTAEMQEITGCVGKEVSKHHQRKSRSRAARHDWYGLLESSLG
jgi:glycine/D-amino acid oxidase-like deaminating enzyme